MAEAAETDEAAGKQISQPWLRYDVNSHLQPCIAFAAALTVLLEANGYSDASNSKLCQITKLEMFLQDYPQVT
jgi:hypothetical protein